MAEGGRRVALPPHDDLRDDASTAHARAGSLSGEVELTREVWEHGKRKRSIAVSEGGLRLIVLGASFASMLCVSIVLPFFQQYALKELQLTDRAVGVILSVSPGAQLLTSVAWTALQAQCGRAPSLILGLLLLGCGGVLFGLSQSFATLLA